MVCAVEDCTARNTTKNTKVIKYLVAQEAEIESILPFTLRDGHCGKICVAHYLLQKESLEARKNTREALSRQEVEPSLLPLVPLSSISPSKEKPGPKGKLSEEEKVLPAFHHFSLTSAPKKKKKKKKKKEEEEEKNFFFPSSIFDFLTPASSS